MWQNTVSIQFFFISEKNIHISHLHFPLLVMWQNTVSIQFFYFRKEYSYFSFTFSTISYVAKHCFYTVFFYFRKEYSYFSFTFSAISYVAKHCFYTVFYFRKEYSYFSFTFSAISYVAKHCFYTVFFISEKNIHISHLHFPLLVMWQNTVSIQFFYFRKEYSYFSFTFSAISYVAKHCFYTVFFISEKNIHISHLHFPLLVMWQNTVSIQFFYFRKEYSYFSFTFSAISYVAKHCFYTVFFISEKNIHISHLHFPLLVMWQNTVSIQFFYFRKEYSYFSFTFSTISYVAKHCFYTVFLFPKRIFIFLIYIFRY